MTGTSTITAGSWGVSDEQVPAEQMHETSGFANPASWLVEAFSATSDSGERVTHSTALTSGPLYQAITLIADTLASMPVETYRTGASRDKLLSNHPIYRLWNETGNEDMLPFHVRQTLQGWALLHGNGIGAIEWRNGTPVGVYPLAPGSVWAQRLPGPQRLSAMDVSDEMAISLAHKVVYRYSLPDGYQGVLWPWEVFHLKLFGNGLWGYSPLDLFARTIGNGLATEKYAGRLYANSARPSGVLEKQYGPGIPTLTDDYRQTLRREWNEVHQGVDNVGKVAVLQQGLKFIPLSITPEQAQFIDTLKYHREQIAAFYKIPPHKLGAMENSAVRANIEEQNRAFYFETIRPHAIVFAQECAKKLLSTRERVRRSVQVYVNPAELLKADLKTRGEFYQTMRMAGAMSGNDIRREERWDEQPGLDEYWRPLNVIDVVHGQQMDALAVEEKEKALEEPEPVQEPLGDINTDDADDDTEAEAESENMWTRIKTLQVGEVQCVLSARRRYKAHQFDNWAREYYQILPAVLRAMGMGPAAADEYAAGSLADVLGVRTEAELQTITATWPERINHGDHA